MKPIFNLQRYGRLMVDTLRTSFKDTLFPVAIVLGTILVIFIWSLFIHKISEGAYSVGYNAWENSSNYTPDFIWPREIAFFWVGLALVSIFCASRMFQTLQSKASSISYLMLPASNLEKYLSRWTILIPGCFILYVLGFQVVDLLRCLIALIIFGNDPSIHPIGFTNLLIDQNDAYATFGILFCMFMVQSFYALGSSIWPRRPIIFTSAWLVGLTIAMSVWLGALFSSFVISNSLPNNTIDISEGEAFAYFGIFAFIVCAINYTLAYFRFKEAEIIHRW